jgi:hypothetical protein
MSRTEAIYDSADEASPSIPNSYSSPERVPTPARRKGCEIFAVHQPQGFSSARALERNFVAIVVRT